MSVGALGIDYAWARPDLAAAKAAGYSFIARYLAPVNSQTAGRVITPVEVAQARSLGLGVVLVWEWGASDSLGGYNTGRNFAVQANQQADLLGFPADRPIYYATDSDQAWSTVQPYYQGCRDASRRPIGIYGGIRVVDPALSAGIASFGWQTVAWSNRQVSTLAHLYQRLAPTIPSGIPADSIDENVALKPDFGAAWLPDEEDTMALTDQEHGWLAGLVMMATQQQARMGDIVQAAAPDMLRDWYRQHLGRAPSDAEVDGWLQGLAAGTQTLAGIRAFIATSTEAKAWAAAQAKAKS